MCTPFHPVTKISDIIGWNLYLGWYVPFKWLNDCFMTFYHTFWPKRALSYSEYGAEGMPNLHSKHPKRGDHTEEYQAIYHEYMLRCFKRHPYLWGTYIWNMFDFAADARNQGGEPGMNHKGMITFDRLTKKTVSTYIKHGGVQNLYYIFVQNVMKNVKERKQLLKFTQIKKKFLYIIMEN